jgi:hypothetical protein
MPKKRKPIADAPPVPLPRSDSPDGIAMVQVGPDHWIGLPTFDINEWFDTLEIPPDARAGILERGGGYDGFRVSPELLREALQWLHNHGRAGASAQTRYSAETMDMVAKRFARKQPGENELLEHLRRLDIRDELKRQAEVKAWGRPAGATAATVAAPQSQLSPELDGVPAPDDALVRKMKGNARCLLIHLWGRGNVSREEIRAVLHAERRKREPRAAVPTDRAVGDAVNYLARKLSEAGCLQTKLTKNGGMYYLSHPQK